MDIEERIARIEAILTEDQKIDRLERKGLKIAKFVLLVIALIAPIVWAIFELILFLINRFDAIRQSLNR